MWAMPTDALHPSLTERDLDPRAGELIEDVRTQERAAHLLAATITWLGTRSPHSSGCAAATALPPGRGPHALLRGRWWAT